MRSNKASVNTKETASLAKLYLSESELSSFEKDMEAIIGFANEISAAPAPKGPAPLREKAELRSDKVKSGNTKKALLAAAPKDSTDSGCFTVPRVVE